MEGCAGRCGVDGLMHPGPFDDILFEVCGKIGAIEWGRNGLCSSPFRMAPSRTSRRRLTMIALDFSGRGFRQRSSTRTGFSAAVRRWSSRPDGY